MTLRKPTRAEIVAAAKHTVPDVIAPGLRVLFCGINPSLYSAAVGHHFARPGNRFWKTLEAAGLTEHVLSPWEDRSLPALREGNVPDRFAGDGTRARRPDHSVRQRMTATILDKEVAAFAGQLRHDLPQIARRYTEVLQDLPVLVQEYPDKGLEQNGSRTCRSVLRLLKSAEHPLRRPGHDHPDRGCRVCTTLMIQVRTR